MVTSKPRRAFSLIPLLLAAALSACGGGGDAPAATPADLPPDPPVVQQGPGALLSGAFVKTLSAADITQALRSPDSKVEEGVVPRYDVSSYRIRNSSFRRKPESRRRVQEHLDPGFRRDDGCSRFQVEAERDFLMVKLY